MAQHLLHLADAGPPGEQMRGEGVAERVRADFLRNPGCLRTLPDDVENHHTGQAFPFVVQKKRIGMVFIHRQRSPLIEIIFDQPDRRGTDRHQPLLVAFADYTDKSVLEKEVADAQRHQFADAQAAAVKRFEHRLIAVPETVAQVNRADDRIDFIE